MFSKNTLSKNKLFNNIDIQLYCILFFILVGCSFAPNVISLKEPYAIFSIIAISIISIFYFKKQKINFFNLKINWIDSKILFIYISAALPLYYSTIVYYFQSHYLNLFKALTLSLTEIILFFLSILNPFFIPFPFLINSYIFKYISIFDKLPLTDKLLSIAFISTTYILWLIDFFYLSKKIKNKSKRISIWIYSFSFTVGCSYFAPALAKLFLGNWVFNNSIDEIYLEHVWKNGFDLFTGNTDFVASKLKLFSPLLCSVALISELLPILTLNYPRKFVYALILSTSLHIGIFIFSGILFWKWIVIDLALLVVILNLVNKKQINYSSDLFLNDNILKINFGPLIGSSAVLCIYFVGKYTLFPFLGWYDPQNSWMWEFKVKNINGVELTIPNKEFAPYSMQFGQHRWNDIFFSVKKQRILNIPRGDNPNFTPNGEHLLLVGVSDEELIREWQDLETFPIKKLKFKEIDNNFIHVFGAVPYRICKSKNIKNDFFPVFNHIWSGNYYTKKELNDFCKDINNPITFSVNFLEEIRLYNPRKKMNRKTKIIEYTYMPVKDSLGFYK